MSGSHRPAAPRPRKAPSGADLVPPPTPFPMRPFAAWHCYREARREALAQGCNCDANEVLFNLLQPQFCELLFEVLSERLCRADEGFVRQFRVRTCLQRLACLKEGGEEPLPQLRCGLDERHAC